MSAYQDQHKRLSLADVTADSSKQKLLFICPSVGLGSTNSRMPTFQLDRKRQLGGDSIRVETQLLFLNVPPQNPCLNTSIFIPFCKSRLFLSQQRKSICLFPFQHANSIQLHATIVTRSPFVRVTPGEDKPCTSLT